MTEKLFEYPDNAQGILLYSFYLISLTEIEPKIFFFNSGTVLEVLGEGRGEEREVNAIIIFA